MATRTVVVAEAGRPVVTHTFHGRTAADAREVEAAHRTSDRFLDAALAGRRYQGLRLTVRRARPAGRRVARR